MWVGLVQRPICCLWNPQWELGFLTLTHPLISPSWLMGLWVKSHHSYLFFFFFLKSDLPIIDVFICIYISWGCLQFLGELAEKISTVQNPWFLHLRRELCRWEVKTSPLFKPWILLLLSLIILFLNLDL